MVNRLDGNSCGCSICNRRVIGNSSSNNDRNERLIDGNNNPNSVHIYDDKEKHHDNHSELIH